MKEIKENGDNVPASVEQQQPDTTEAKPAPNVPADSVAVAKALVELVAEQKARKRKEAKEARENKANREVRKLKVFRGRSTKEVVDMVNNFVDSDNVKILNYTITNLGALDGTLREAVVFYIVADQQETT